MKKYDNCVPVGDKLYIKRLNLDVQMESGGIVLPTTFSRNNTLGVGKILKLTKIAEEKWGLSEGEYILYDFHSVYDKSNIHRDETAIIDSENVILKITEQEARDFSKKYLR